LLEFLFTNYPVYIWAYFFGLILASVYFVGRTVRKWKISVLLVFMAGTVIALSISFLSPARENEGFLYLVICGVIAVCSMILPGLSGSFVLILLGNYQLVMIKAVNDLRLEILLPVILGAGIGLIAFSHLLSWIFKKFREQTIAGLTGFILGSLVILWPWKRSFDNRGIEIATNKMGAFVSSEGTILSDVKVYAYDLIAPSSMDGVVWMSVFWMVLGIISIIFMEKLAGTNKN
jgi:putative membrane protein